MDRTISLHNGVQMPLLGFGTFKVSETADCEQCVIDAVQAGYRLIDTAQAYGTEEAVGAGIQNCGIPREEIFLTTKVWFRNFETADCRNSLEESFRNLKTDYLDLVLLHWPFGNVYAAWRVLEEYYEAGKIRAIGVSNMEPDRLVDILSFNRIKPMVNQVETHLYCQQQYSHQWMEKYGVVHQAYTPLARTKAGEMLSEPAVLEIARAHGKTPAQVALRFLLQSNISAIPKSARPERIRENIQVFDFALSEEEMARLRLLDTATPMIGFPANPNKVETALTW